MQLAGGSSAGAWRGCECAGFPLALPPFPALQRACALVGDWPCDDGTPTGRGRAPCRGLGPGSGEQCFPVVEIKTTYKNRKVWLTPALKKAIRVKNKLYVKSIRTPTVNNISVYKKYRNALNGLLRKTERKYYSRLLEENKNNLVESWKIIKKVINKNTTNLVSKRFSLNDDYITDGNIIADHFNDMYVNLGKNLSANINTVSNRAPESYISLCNKNSLYFEPVSEDEIVKIVLQMKNSSPGSDGITAKILKQSCH